MTTSLKEAISLAESAVAADRQERYGDALTLYVQAGEAFVQASAKAATASKASAIKAKAVEYVQRAEAIRELLDRHPQMARRRRAAESAPSDSGGGNSGSPSPDSMATDVVEQTVMSERPNVRWTDIVGADDAKSALKEAIVLPLRFPDAYRQARLKPWSGILLYGPPGTGKTLLAKAAAAESQATFFAVSASAILSKWLGESSRRIRELFDEARRRSPSVIFVDEVDSMLTERREDDGGKRQVKTEFFVQMDGMQTDEDARVLVLAATNTPWSLDEAAMRRFEQRIYVPLPTPDARRTLFGDMATDEVVAATDGYSAADVASIVRLARMQPMREACMAERFVHHVDDNMYEACDGTAGEAMSLEQVPDNQLRLRLVDRRDILHAVERTPASVTNQSLKRFEEWRRE